MRAAVLIAPGRFEIVEKPMPRLDDGDVLISVHRVGICGSDVHIYKGEYEREQLPRVLGHEFAGDVVEIRSAKPQTFAVGDLVTADINIGCGTCGYCRSRNAVLCQRVKKIGVQRDGAFAEYISVPAAQIVSLPGGMTPAEGALVEPAGCVARSLRRSSLKAGDSLLVIGAGPMGMLHIQLARAIGVGSITVLEMNSQRAAAALAVGADAIARSVEDLQQHADTDDDIVGFDVVAECVGLVHLYELAVAWVKPGGSVSCFGIEHASRRATYSPFDLVLAEKSLIGSVGAVAADMRDAIDLLHSRAIDTTLYTQHVFRLADVDLAMRAFFEQKIGLKVQINPHA